MAVDLNPYFLNEEECFHESRYAAGIIYFRTSVNIFSEEKAAIKKVIYIKRALIILLWQIRVLWVELQTKFVSASTIDCKIQFYRFTQMHIWILYIIY